LIYVFNSNSFMSQYANTSAHKTQGNVQIKMDPRKYIIYLLTSC
jgi:hypothetical protein